MDREERTINLRGKTQLEVSNSPPFRICTGRWSGALVASKMPVALALLTLHLEQPL